MQSLASAARLLGKCISVDGAAPLLAELGFPVALVPLTIEGAKALLLPEVVCDVRIARGTGSLRALGFLVSTHGDIRDAISRVAARLGSRAPQLLWLLIAIHPDKQEVAIAAFDSARRHPRVAALVVSVREIVDSDSETLCALAASHDESDVLVHCRWLDILGRESVSRRFFRELDRMVQEFRNTLIPAVAPADAAELSLLCVSRLLFLSFIETKGWLDGDHAFLANRFADCMCGGGEYHRKVLTPLFFGTLNTHPLKRSRRAKEFGRIPFLNGGLFARAPVEKRVGSYSFTDESLGDLFGDLLSRYRFTAREDTTAWSQAAIDPEMLGKAFESLMSSTERKTSGAFYTPQSLVREVTRSALTYGLASAAVSAQSITALLDGEIPRKALRERILERVESARVLDPACGSGAFLVHMLEELSALRVRLGDTRSLHAIRRTILTRSIFGVDVNPRAVWLCELRLWLSMAIEDPEQDPLRVTPLPNLDRNIRVGDSLAGEAFNGIERQIAARKISAARGRYVRANGPRKRSLAKALDALERSCAISASRARLDRLLHERREVLVLCRSRDLFGERHRASSAVSRQIAELRESIRAEKRELRRLREGGALAFSFASGFADAASSGGFDLIAGNPPWVRTHNLCAASRESLRERFSVYRNAAWMGGSEASAAGRGFSSQVDAAALFVERCADLLRPGGAMALIVPSKLWRSLAGGGVRQFLLDRCSLREIRDLTGEPQVFDAAVYPSVVVAASPAPLDVADKAARDASIALSARGAGTTRHWRSSASGLSLDSSPGSPWLIVPQEVRTAWNILTGRGIALSASDIGRPVLGVKTGCNDAFLITSDAAESAGIERAMLRPAIKGNGVRQWCVQHDEEKIIWTHDRTGKPMKTIPPEAQRWLGGWRRELEQRTDFRGPGPWWMLFRTEGAERSLPRVVWSDFGKSPRAAVIAAGDEAVPINTCYVARCRDQTDADALAALLNSSLIAAWLAVIAEPARGGYRRYLGWTMSLLPLPRMWRRTRGALASLGSLARKGAPPCAAELLSASLTAYGLDLSDVEPLLEWSK